MTMRDVVLGDIADISLGKMLDQRKNKGEYQPYLANVNVRWGGFDLDNLPQMRFLDSEEERYGLKYGDILVCEGGEPGRCAIWKNQIPNMKYQKALHRVRVHEKDVDFRWLFYRFLYAKSRGEFDQYFSGTTTIKHMPGEKIVKIKLALPDIKIQKRIGDILSSYDDLIENNRKQIKLLEEVAQRLYKEWFIDLHFPGYETTPIHDGIPEGWKKASADSFFDISIGKTPSRAEKQWFVTGNNGIPWISISDMGNSGMFVFDSEEKLTREAIAKHNVKIIQKGTILLSFKLTIGRVSIATSDMCTNEAIAHFRVNDNQRGYVYCYLKNFKYETLGNTSSISKAVNSSIIKGMPFVMPEHETLVSFSRIISPIMNEIYTKQAQNRRLAESRDRLLPKLMTGEMEAKYE